MGSFARPGRRAQRRRARFRRLLCRSGADRGWETGSRGRGAV